MGAWGSPLRSLALLCSLLAVPLLAGCPAKRAPAADAGAAARKEPRARPPVKRGPPPDIPTEGPLAQKILYEQAKSLLRAGKPGPAVEAFRRAIDAHPRGELVPSCHLGIGSALTEQGKHAEAVTAYRQVVKLRPTDPEAHRALAIGLEESGQVREAAETLEHSLRLDPDQPSAYQDLAALHLRAKNVEAAKKVYLRYEITRTRLILTLARNKDEETRAKAAQLLGEAKDEATAKALTLALTDRSRTVRLSVIRALGQQALPGGAGPLRELLGRTGEAEEKRQIELALKAIAAAPPPGSQPAPTPKK